MMHCLASGSNKRSPARSPLLLQQTFLHWLLCGRSLQLEHVYGVAGFYVVVKFLEVPRDAPLGAVLDASKELCSRPWSWVSGWFDALNLRTVLLLVSRTAGRAG
jgi:hypothetical protein